MLNIRKSKTLVIEWRTNHFYIFICDGFSAANTMLSNRAAPQGLVSEYPNIIPSPRHSTSSFHLAGDMYHHFGIVKHNCHPHVQLSLLKTTSSPSKTFSRMFDGGFYAAVRMYKQCPKSARSRLLVFEFETSDVIIPKNRPV
jgi:hypothetical protein